MSCLYSFSGNFTRKLETHTLVFLAGRNQAGRKEETTEDGVFFVGDLNARQPTGEQHRLFCGVRK